MSGQPSVVAISLVEVEIWKKDTYDYLLQSVTIQIRRLFLHISYYKVPQSNFIAKCGKGRQVLQSTTVITK